MNSRTARLLRRYAAATRTPKRWWFRAWNETPRNKRRLQRTKLVTRVRMYLRGPVRGGKWTATVGHQP